MPHATAHGRRPRIVNRRTMRRWPGGQHATAGGIGATCPGSPGDDARFLPGVGKNSAPRERSRSGLGTIQRSSAGGECGGRRGVGGHLRGRFPAPGPCVRVRCSAMARFVLLNATWASQSHDGRATSPRADEYQPPRHAWSLRMAASCSPPWRGTTAGRLPRAPHDEGRGRAPARCARAQPMVEPLGNFEVTRSFLAAA